MCACLGLCSSYTWFCCCFQQMDRNSVKKSVRFDYNEDCIEVIRKEILNWFGKSQWEKKRKQWETLCWLPYCR